MKRLIIVLNIFSMISISSGQDIRVSKDTLKYLECIYPHNRKVSDSIYVYNTGKDILSIDSIYNFYHRFNYLLVFSYKDKTDSLYVGRSSSMNIFPLEIPPNDSIRFIFRFILPVTKRSLGSWYRDSLIIYNNSHNQPRLKINIMNNIETNVDSKTIIPISYLLLQNYPNPFNPTTTIKYSIPLTELVTLKVFDILGKEITTLVNEEKQQGNYELKFDGSNFTSGVYLYRMQAGSFVETKKLILLK